MGGERRAAIDLGTNTCLLLIADWDPAAGRVAAVRADLSTVVRLGQGVDRARRLDPAARERTLACLEEYAAKIKAAGLAPAAARCAATSQARDAGDGAEFFAAVRERTGLRFRVLSGEEEARLTFRGGLLPGMDPARWAVIDIGGGSTELIGAGGGQSLDLGAVRFTERYLEDDPPAPDQVAACRAEIDRRLAALAPWRRSLPAGTGLVAVAGTPTSLAAWKLDLAVFDAAAVEAVTLSREELGEMAEALLAMTVAQRRSLPAMEPGREDVIAAGALILWRALAVLDFAACRVSARGLRYGLILGDVFQ